MDLLSKKCFTLAEVLITLAIIGVVASLTIPLVVQNYKKHEASTRLKKFYSIMNNAVNLAQLEYGKSILDWDYSLSYENFWNKYFANHVNCQFKENLEGQNNGHGYENIVYNNGNGNYSACYFTDGTILAHDKNDTQGPYIYDINGLKKPNKLGFDQFTFAIGSYGPGDTKCKGFAPSSGDGCYLYSKEDERKWSCEYAYLCTGYLFLNNWDFGNYPHNL